MNLVQRISDKVESLTDPKAILANAAGLRKAIITLNNGLEVLVLYNNPRFFPRNVYVSMDGRVVVGDYDENGEFLIEDILNPLKLTNRTALAISFRLPFISGVGANRKVVRSRCTALRAMALTFLPTICGPDKVFLNKEVAEAAEERKIDVYDVRFAKRNGDKASKELILRALELYLLNFGPGETLKELEDIAKMFGVYYITLRRTLRRLKVIYPGHNTLFTSKVCNDRYPLTRRCDSRHANSVLTVQLVTQLRRELTGKSREEIIRKAEAIGIKYQALIRALTGLTWVIVPEPVAKFPWLNSRKYKGAVTPLEDEYPREAGRIVKELTGRTIFRYNF